MKLYSSKFGAKQWVVKAKKIISIQKLVHFCFGAFSSEGKINEPSRFENASHLAHLYLLKYNEFWRQQIKLQKV